MIMQMGFQNLLPRYRYEKLISEDYGGKMKVRRRCFWVKKMNGKMMKGIKMSKSKRFNWKAYSLILFPRKIARIYNEVVKRLIDLNCGSNNIILTSTWGIPVLSHHPVNCRRNFNFV
ncbi:hypothetical protein RND81_13G173900 [Saponaria officinalis]|uniref:Uncharacterized protein n=1 Tax=Saponaria officinalis TaxID=3572 RepID=A0AAW1H124_SAPOF